MKVSPIIFSTLLTALILWFFAIFEVGPLTGCSMGIMRLPFMLGIVPPVTGVLSLPTYFALTLCDKYGIENQLAQAMVALLIQMPLAFVITALVTPLEDGQLWDCVVG
ncbi:MAG: hypothetical protein AAF564_16875 [Bacteroidota bacterium]